MNTALPCDGGSTVKYNEASDRSTGEKFSTMGGVKASKKLAMSHGREKRKIGIILEKFEWDILQIFQGFETLINDAPGFGGTQVSANILEGAIVLTKRSCLLNLDLFYEILICCWFLVFACCADDVLF